MRIRRSALIFSGLLPFLSCGCAMAQPAVTQEGTRPHGGMLRYPDVSATHVAFVYANDIWLVPRDGGLAAPLASPPGQEAFPRFSPDGRQIAFLGNYEGNPDLYVLPVTGGVAARVTHHPSAELLTDWTAEGRLLYFASGLGGLTRQTQLFTVDPAGGLPAQVPVPYGANGAISADGTWLAYTPHSIDMRTWKRYRGGMATDIWLFNLKDRSSRQITNWEGTDTLPMWHGDTVYYLCDAGENHKLNLWAYRVSDGQRRQVTNLDTFDCRWPAMGPGPDGKGEIVFQHGSNLMLLDLATEKSRTVEVVIPGDRPKIRAKAVDPLDNLGGTDLSATGKRVVIEARGDLFTVPAQEGSTRSLTRTSGVAERDPSWSPDGRWIAYFSDATGEYELYVTRADGKGETRQLTRDSRTFYYNPRWSPDSKWIVTNDKAGVSRLHNVETAETKVLDVDPWTGAPDMSWSHDSGWITWARGTETNTNGAIFLHHVATGETHQVTSGMFNDSAPTFDRKGDYLYFASNREFTRPTYEDVGTTFIYADTDRLILVPLRKDVKSPYLAKSDEEEPKKEGEKKEGDEKKDGEEKKDEDRDDGDPPADADKPDKESGDAVGGDAQESGDKPSDDGKGEKKDDKDAKKDEEKKPVTIDLDGFERRAILLPVDRGQFFGLMVSEKGHLVYGRARAGGADIGPGGGISLKILDAIAEKKDDRKEKTIAEGVAGFGLSADGKKLLVVKPGGRQMYVVEPAADQKLEKAVPLDGLRMTVEPREEWRQIFTEAWRVQRDFFYDPHMHGVDWNEVRERYLKMLEDCTSREDVTYVIGEMISELNVGHAYARGGGDVEQGPSVSVGMLGCDFERVTDPQAGAVYRIARILEGAPWDLDARGPLSEPGVNVKEGDFLLAVNGAPIDPAKDPWAAFQGLAGKTVTLTVSEKASLDDSAREVVVTLLSSDTNLRYRAWIERNRKYVADKTDGRVGYIYVPNTGIDGQNDLFRQFYGQRYKAALIIDERWNGGGQIPTRFIELLNRPVTNYWARRDGNDWTWPPDSHQGPKCMLINGLAGSGGDMFPALFRQSGLGKLIGMRTWGGLVGISGNPQLIDGGNITAPTFAFYERDGTWGIEGHGVDPDLEVIDDPAKMADGGDPQLDAAIAHMLEELQRNPYVKPARPAYPDRSGMGIREEDK